MVVGGGLISFVDAVVSGWFGGCLSFVVLCDCRFWFCCFDYCV